MRRSTKITVSVARVPLRKASVAAVAPRRAFPAWIDASEGGTMPAALTVTPRVRDGLVLRVVPKGKLTPVKGTHGSGGR